MNELNLADVQATLNKMRKKPDFTGQERDVRSKLSELTDARPRIYRLTEIMLTAVGYPQVTCALILQPQTDGSRMIGLEDNEVDR